MIDFLKIDNRLIFRYTPELRENWVSKAFEQRDKIIFKKTFTFNQSHLVELKNSEEEEADNNADDYDGFESSHFLFAALEGDYYKIERGILVDDFEIYIQKNLEPAVSYFVADSNVSVFKAIESISIEDFFIGGDNSTAIPFEAFENMLQYFPKSYERRKYVEARVSSVLRNYLDNVKDAEKIYQIYLNKKLSKQGVNLTKSFQEFELIKCQTILDKLTKMLNEESEYNEHNWQEEILQIILLLYPKYIFVFKSVPINAKNAEGIKEKQLDFLLVDSNGNTDIIEIKKPFENVIMTKGVYRDNYIPLRELSGTVMQIEKYIYYLNRWSYEGEKSLTEKYKHELPKGFDIKITNPSGIIIMGRENNLSVEQKRDFEVVKRKYKNVVDIITYDNLLERLRLTIEQIKKI
jgi:hypothetical protein